MILRQGFGCLEGSRRRGRASAAAMVRMTIDLLENFYGATTEMGHAYDAPYGVLRDTVGERHHGGSFGRRAMQRVRLHRAPRVGIWGPCGGAAPCALARCLGWLACAPAAPPGRACANPPRRGGWRG